MIATLLFAIAFVVIFYAYLGYGIVLTASVLAKRIADDAPLAPDLNDTSYEPEVTLFVAAYNEKDFLHEKVKNSFALNYPPSKIKHLWITDGSDDGTPDLLKKYTNIEVHHKPEREGKTAAINRGMRYVKTPIVIFSDGNTLLSRDTVREIVARFRSEKTGCVAGEKKIFLSQRDTASVAGEGIYWRYESVIKRLDAELNSAVGAVGELFAIRTKLFEPVETDTILDDFVISLRIAMRGYKIDYAPGAYAMEAASANIEEELKRKIRIAAGSVQAVKRLKPLLNPLKYGLLSVQYWSHKVIRWFGPPIAFPLLFASNLYIAVSGNSLWFRLFFVLQFAFYLTAILGYVFENKRVSLKIFFVPYYVCMINYAVVAGVIRYFRGQQSEKWERAQRGVINQ